MSYMGGKVTALDHFNAFRSKIGDQGAQGDSQPQQQGNGQLYWYVYCMKQGKNALLGPYDSQPDASKAAQDKVSGWSYRILGFRTRNRAAAVQMLKHDIASGGAMAKAIHAMQHSV